MRLLVSLLSILGTCSAAADPLALSLLDAERNLGVHARHAALRSAEPDTAERLDAQLQLLELHAADSKLSPAQRQKAEGVLRLLQAVRAEPRTLDGQPELPHPTVAVGEAGRSCAQALPLDQGDARRVPIGPGESLWFRVQLPDAVNLGLSTRGSSVDAALTVHTDCRTVDQPAVAHADDSYGLQADLVVPTARQAFWLVRYENLSPVGGEAVLRATTSGILQGTVRTREGVLLPGVQPRVLLFRRQGGFWSFWTSAQVNNGSFSMSVTQQGIYGARTERLGNSPFIDQAFDQINCLGSAFNIEGCNGGNVTQIALSGAETRTIEFQLDRGIPVTGTVRTHSGAAIPGALVELRMDGGPGGSATTDSSGRYRIDGNPAGIARLRASATQYRSIMYNDLPCNSFCNFPSGGTPLPLTDGFSAVADFNLPASPVVSINISMVNDQISNFNNVGSGFELAILRPNGTLVASYSVPFWLPRSSISDLAPGEYLLRLTSPFTIPRLYPDVDCESDCVSELALAQRVMLPNEPVTIPVDFAVRRYPMIFGTVRDAVSGLPVVGQSFNSQVELLRLGSSSTQSVSIGTDGNYFHRGIWPATYILRAQTVTHQPAVHDGYTCEAPLNQCTEFTPIALSRNSPDRRIDFSLTPLGRLIVTVNNPVESNQWLGVMTPAGSILREISFFTGSSNTRVIDSIPIGSRLAGLRASGALPQLFQNVDCLLPGTSSFAGCPFGQATTLLIQPGQTQSIFFNQRPENARRVVVRAADTGTPLSGVNLDLWNDAGVRARGFITDATGSAWIGIGSSASSGTFALSTDNRQDYVDQIHAGINCPNGSAFLGLCSLTGATSISLPAPDNNQPTIEILLQRETPLFRSGFEPSN